MSTEFNYVVNVDTSRVMGAMSEIRSQVGMAFGGGGGAGSSFGFGDIASGLSNVAGAAASGFSHMLGAMSRGSVFGGAGGFGGTHTNEAMAFSPHYGVVQADTTMRQEWLVQRYGLAAAQDMRPPGVSAAEYALGVHSNRIDREHEARAQSISAGRTAFMSTAGGLAAGGVADMAVGAAASYGAKALGFGGLIAGGAGFIAGAGAFTLASDFVSGFIEKREARAEQEVGVSKELGVIAGAGRGLSRLQEFNLGRAAFGAARDIGMDANQMGDVLALSRHAGLLPSSTDPTKARQQFAEFARTIEEGAQMLHTSLAGATQVVKQAVSHGMTAEEGIQKALGMGGPAAFSRYLAFGAQGAGVARGMGLAGAQGFGLFTSALGQMSGAGLSGEEMRILGGQYGAASLLGTAQMAAATSPLGDLQLMAAQGGQGLGGLMELPGQAISAMSGGPGMAANMIDFMVHKDEYRRGIGARGIQTMARHQVASYGGMIQDVFGVDTNTARRFAAMNMWGVSGTQAEGIVGGLFGGGGGGGISGERYAQALQAQQGMRMSRGIEAINTRDIGALEELKGYAGDFLGNNAGKIGLAAAAITAPVSAPLAGAIALGTAAYKWGGDVVEWGRELFESPTETRVRVERENAAAYDAKMAAYKEEFGIIDIDPRGARAAAVGDFSGAHLELNLDGSKTARRNTALALAFGGAYGSSGPGSMAFGGASYNAGIIQQIAVGGRATKDEKAAAARVAQKLGDGGPGVSARLTELVGTINKAAENKDVRMANRAFNDLGSLVAGSGAAPSDVSSLLGGLRAKGGVYSDVGKEFFSTLGITLPDTGGKFYAGQALAVSAGGYIGQTEAAFAEAMRAANEDMLPQSKAQLDARRELLAGAVRYGPLREAYGGVLAQARREGGSQAEIDDRLGSMLESHFRRAWRAKLPPGATEAEEAFHAWRTTGPGAALSWFGASVESSREKHDQRLDTYWAAVIRDPNTARAAQLNQTDNEKSKEEASKLMDEVRMKALKSIPNWYEIAPRVANKGLDTMIKVEQTPEQKAKYRKDWVTTGIEPMTGEDMYYPMAGADPGAALDASIAQSKKMREIPVSQFVLESTKHLDAMKPKKRRRRGKRVERAIGFGQQESAMSSINRSLKRTHGMIKDLYNKKVDKPS